jgi:hypothetical protein
MKRFLMNRNTSMRLGILTLLLTVPCLTANATTIVVARTPTEIVIGADSKVTDSYGGVVDNSACKIQQVGNLFVAFEGLLRDKKTGFNVAEIARRALQLKPNASAAEKVDILTGFVTSALFEELNQARINSPQEFRIKLEGQTFLRIVVAGFEGNRPVVFVRQFRTAFMARNIGVVVIPDDCLKDCKGEVVTRFIGEIGAIEGLPEETQDFWKAGLISGVRRLLEIEIAARSEYVGAPIDILQINARGARWVQKKPECPNIRAVKNRRRR